MTSRAAPRWLCTRPRTALAFVNPWISYAVFAAAAVMWFVPDRRLSRP